MIGRSPSRFKCEIATHLFRRMVFGAPKTVAFCCSFLDGEDEADVLYGVDMFLSSIVSMFVCPV